MWNLKSIVLVTGFTLSSLSAASTIEVDVHGLTCAFCVDSLQRQLRKLPDVENVDISLKSKKLRIITRSDNTDLEKIKATVINSGFTPVKIRTLEDDP
ncbi:MAG: heavy-metal-associated domain-containing protein [Pseudomonadales bacterium]|nr:heavy-metal-associated domain-containing protein [Pseudomonadales bacterium]